MGTWLRHRPVEVAEQRLVLLPHAGGTVQAFERWPDRLAAGIETIAVQYPGRQDRISEACVEDMDTMANAIANELEPLADLPISMFGHSMGSAVAYEVAVRLERNGVVIQHVFVSARTAPHRRDGETNQLLDDENLVAVLRELGGATEVYDRPKLWPLILPPLRSDLRLLNAHRPRSLVPLRSPVTAFGGDSDETCPVADLDAWADATNAGFQTKIFSGRHHYLADNEDGVIDTVSQLMAPSASTPTVLEITRLWVAHLGVAAVGADDDFFALGGHSLAGMKILDDIRSLYDVDIAPSDFYSRPTPAALAAAIDCQPVRK